VTSTATPKIRMSFEDLVRAHQALVFSIAYHFLHDRDTAEEVAQEVFLTLHRHLDELESAEHVEFWLRKVAARRSIDAARQKKRRPSIALDDIAEPSSNGPAPGDPMRDDLLRRLVATLPEAPRMVTILRYQEDLDPSEIAAVLDMPLATVKSHLHRSLAMLREKLARRGMGES
jgi:RNA polymerase sigma-70 factor (ECF subfamily)